MQNTMSHQNRSKRPQYRSSCRTTWRLSRLEVFKPLGRLTRRYCRCSDHRHLDTTFDTSALIALDRISEFQEDEFVKEALAKVRMMMTSMRMASATIICHSPGELSSSSRAWTCASMHIISKASWISLDRITKTTVRITTRGPTPSSLESAPP